MKFAFGPCFILGQTAQYNAVIKFLSRVGLAANWVIWTPQDRVVYYGRLITIYSLDAGLLLSHPTLKEVLLASFLRDIFVGTCIVGIGLIAINGFAETFRLRQAEQVETERQKAAGRTLNNTFWVWESGCLNNLTWVSQLASDTRSPINITQLANQTFNGLSEQQINAIESGYDSLFTEAINATQTMRDLEESKRYIAGALGFFEDENEILLSLRSNLSLSDERAQEILWQFTTVLKTINQLNEYGVGPPSHVVSAEGLRVYRENMRVLWIQHVAAMRHTAVAVVQWRRHNNI